MVERSVEFSVSLGDPLKKPSAFFRRHPQHIMDSFPAITNSEDCGLNRFPSQASQVGIDIFEEIHLQLFDAVSFASVAPSPGGIEGEVAWAVNPLATGIALGGERAPNLIKGFEVGDRI